MKGLSRGILSLLVFACLVVFTLPRGEAHAPPGISKEVMRKTPLPFSSTKRAGNILRC